MLILTIRCAVCRGNPIPDGLIENVVGYLPDDINKLLSVFEVQFFTLILLLQFDMRNVFSAVSL